MNTKNKVKEFLSQYMDIASISDTDNIFEMRLVNSLFAMQLVNFIEQEFDVTLDNDELDIDNFKDINSIVALIDSKLN
ncbi:MAG: phosphopantetheine-binding protein [Acutalibacteraceae bacterium]